MRDFAQNFWCRHAGQDVAEYAIMLAVILVLAVGAVQTIGANPDIVFSSVGSSIR